MAAQAGSIVALHLCVGHRRPMRDVAEATFVEGLGIQGDRHASREPGASERQVLLMDQETLEAFGLDHGQVRENVTTSGLDLSRLVRGMRLALGERVVLEVTKPCRPCSRMDEIRLGLQREIAGRRGVLAKVVTGGTAQVGDAIRVLESASV